MPQFSCPSCNGLMEVGPATEIYEQPRHPYTQALLEAIPVPDPARTRTRVVLTGDISTQQITTRGCPFAERCPHPRKDERCRSEAPALRELSAGHTVACHHADHQAEE